MRAAAAVRCELYRCTLPASACALRTVRLSFQRHSDSPRFPLCAECETGKRRREWLERQGWTPGNLRNYLRPDHRQQLAARQRYLATRVVSEFVPAEFGGAG